MSEVPEPLTTLMGVPVELGAQVVVSRNLLQRGQPRSSFSQLPLELEVHGDDRLIR